MHTRAPTDHAAFRNYGQAACLVIGLLACAGCGRSASLDTARTFQRAQEVFDQAQSPEDYLKAAAIYESIRAGGVVSGAVLYNQGNAYMRAGQRGRAVAAYREATRYRPRDPYLLANLKFALQIELPIQRTEYNQITTTKHIARNFQILSKIGRLFGPARWLRRCCLNRFFLFPE